MPDSARLTDGFSDIAVAGHRPEVEIIEADGPVLVVCDHASNHVPPDLAGLGLPRRELQRHIAWDIGAAEVGRRLAGRLGASVVLCGISRLVIDCNRPLGHPTSICPVSDGTVVPGNQSLDARSVAVRAAKYFHPYHAAIGAQLARLESSARRVALIAIHSFTPCKDGQSRPWHAGVLWNLDGRLALPLIRALRDRGDICVGDNQPYSGRDSNYTVDIHGRDHGRPHVSIEIRQDEVGDLAGVLRWAEILAAVLSPLLSDVLG
jgi:predicted N-formylglutamate amidohydrolase